MILLGLDPGATTGWCAYDSVGRRVVASGSFPEDKIADEVRDYVYGCGAIVIERPVAHGPTRPEVVECARIEGMLFGRLRLVTPTHELTRLQVRQRLQAELHGTIRVVNDATVWAALVLLHGEGSDRKPRRKKGQVTEPGGALGGVTGHARAALAVAVAWALGPAAGAPPLVATPSQQG